MTLDMGLAPMALSATTFNAGDKVRVTVDFKYTVESDATVHLYACPYNQIFYYFYFHNLYKYY